MDGANPESGLIELTGEALGKTVARKGIARGMIWGLGRR